MCDFAGALIGELPAFDETCRIISAVWIGDLPSVLVATGVGEAGLTGYRRVPLRFGLDALLEAGAGKSCSADSTAAIFLEQRYSVDQVGYRSVRVIRGPIL